MSISGDEQRMNRDADEFLAPHGWTEDSLDRFVADVRDRTAKRMLRPPRRERVKQSPRCPVCGGFVGKTGEALVKNPTRYVDGVETHRACLGDR